MKVDENVFDRAAALANKSTMVQRHGAVILKNGEIIGEGYNYHTHFMCHSWSVHSEVAALLSLKKQHRHKKFLEDAVMVVVRIGPPSRSDEFKNSKPCERCREAILKSGIRKVFYSC